MNTLTRVPADAFDTKVTWSMATHVSGATSNENINGGTGGFTRNVFHNSENYASSRSATVRATTLATSSFTTNNSSGSTISTGITHDLSLATTQNQTTAINGANTTVTYQTTVVPSYVTPSTGYTTESAFLTWSTVTTTITGDFSQPVTSTVTTLVGAGPATTWQTTASNLTSASTQTVEEIFTTSITYTDHIETQGTASTVTSTYHQRSPLIDTIAIMGGNRAFADFHLGNQLWTFTIGSMAATASTAGVFTQLMASTDAPTFTIPDFRKFSSSSQVATAISVSHNTTNITTSTGTGPTTTTNVQTTWKNGVTWHGTNPANTLTVTQTVDLGEVTTSTYSTDSPADSTFTVFYATSQVGGYDGSGNWTTDTATVEFNSTSATSIRLALYGHAASSEFVYRRTSYPVEFLISSFSSSSFIGYVTTTSSSFTSIGVSTTVSAWEASLNPEIDIYVSSSSQTVTGTAAGPTTHYSVSNEYGLEYWTSSGVTPSIWSESFTTPDIAWQHGPPRGYGGVGGNFSASTLPVHLRMTAVLTSGATLSTTQSFGTTALQTALAYPGVTILLDDNVQTPPGAIAASFISRVSALGEVASVGVTWTGTTLTGTTTETTSAAATHAVYGVQPISGTFVRTRAITYNSADVRGGGMGSGGYALGDAGLSDNYTMRIAGQAAAWTAYNSTSSVSSGSQTSSVSPLTFTVPRSLAIVVSTQPVFSMSWNDGEAQHFSSSTPYFPTP